MAMVELRWNRDKISSVFYDNDEDGTHLEKLEKERRFRSSYVDDIMREMIEEGQLIKKGSSEDSQGQASNEASLDVSTVTPAVATWRRRSSRLSSLSPFRLDDDSPQTSSISSSSKRRRTNE